MITFHEAEEILNSGKGFDSKIEFVDGVPVKIYYYRIVDFEAFKDNPKSLELRGLAVDLSEERPMLAIHKFFNDGENPWTRDDSRWNGVPLEVTEKLDGSLIIPCRIKGRVYFRTRKTFFSSQARRAHEIAGKRFLDSVYEVLKKGLIPFFELITPKDRIVPYEEEKLVLIQVRNIHGYYLHRNDLESLAKEFGFDLVKKENLTIDEIRERCQREKGIEGWVVRNPLEPYHRQFRKFKTKWYFDLHQIEGENSGEHRIVAWVMDEEIDDVLSATRLSPIQERIEKVAKEVMDFYNRAYELTKEAFLNVRMKCETKKEAALKLQGHPFFGCLMKAEDLDSLDRCLRNMIKNRCRTLTRAKEFLSQKEEILRALARVANPRP